MGTTMEEKLQQDFSVKTLNILTSSQISNRTGNIINHLTSTSHSTNNGSNDQQGQAPDQHIAKSPVIILTAKSKSSAKLTSIVEIAKRDLLAKGVKVFQYTSLDSEMVEIERESSKKDNGGKVGDVDGSSGGEEEEEAFQTMGVPIIDPQSKKKRLMPILRVFLATNSIKYLREAYGEQKG